MIVGLYEFGQAIKTGKKAAKRSHYSTRHTQSVYNQASGTTSTYKPGPLPVLECVLLRKRGRQLQVFSTDLEAWAWGACPTSGEDCAICVRADVLAKWIDSLAPSASWKDKREVNLTITPRTCKLLASIKDGGVSIRATFLGIDPDEFPSVDAAIESGKIQTVGNSQTVH